MPTPSPAIVASFLERFHGDRANGTPRTVAEYQQQFPGHEAWIEEEIGRLTQPAGGGESLGPYRIEQLLGHGGQGSVYQAEDTRLGRKVALKVLSDRWYVSEEAVARLQREAAVAARLDHPGICTVYEAGFEDDTAFVAMQLVDGRSLAAILADDPDATLTRGEILRRAGWIEQVAQAIHAAHQQGVVHRDLKPANLLVTPEDQVVTVDFGLARHETGDVTLTRTGELFGTPAYLAPELIASDTARCDPVTDVYALGVTLHQAVTGRLPFHAATREGLFQAILAGQPDDPRRLQPALPPDLAIVLATALEREPVRRYRSARALAEDLAAVRASLPIAAREPSVTTRLLRWVRRDPVRAGLIAGLSLALLGAAGLGGYLAAQRGELVAGQAALQKQELDGWIVAALGLQGEGRSAPVVSRLEEHLAEHPELVLPRAQLGLALLDHGRPAAALEMLDETSDPDPGLVRLRAEALDRLGRFEEAAEMVVELGDASSAVCSFVEGWLEYQAAMQTEDEDRLRRALDHIERAMLQAERAELTLHAARAQIEFHLDEYAALAATAGAMRDLWPEAPSTWSWTAMARLRFEDDLDAALEALNEALARAPRYTEALLWRSLVLLQLGRIEESAADFEAVIQRSEDRAGDRLQDYFSVRGRSLQAMMHFEAAEAPLRRALALDPGDRAAEVALGWVVLRLDGVEEAIGIASNLLEDDERDVDASRILVTAYAANEEYLAAEEELRRFLGLVPGDGLAWLELARLLLALDDAEGGRDAALQAQRHRGSLRTANFDRTAELDQLLAALGE